MTDASTQGCKKCLAYDDSLLSMQLRFREGKCTKDVVHIESLVGLVKAESGSRGRSQRFRGEGETLAFI